MTLSPSLDSFFSDPFFPNPGFYTLSSDLPFLETLAKSLLQWTQKDPLLLSRYIILFPTQRSLRAFKNILAQRAPALFLPHLFTLNDLAPRAEDFLTCLFQNISIECLQTLSLSPPLSLLRGRLLCAEVLRRSGGLFTYALSPQAQENLSKELLETLGELASHNISLLDGDLHIPETHGIHWEKTTFFLKIILETWPLILKAEGASDPLTYVQDRLKIISTLLIKTPPKAPLIVAGIRGLSPVFIPFLKTVFKSHKSVFITETCLPDFQSMDYQTLSPTHPAFELASFLSGLDVSPSRLKPWPYHSKQKDEILKARLSFINEIFPTKAPSKKISSCALSSASSALENVSFFEATSLLEEARLISLRMRHILETPHKTGAFITPDRKLAQLVKTELLKWDIIVDDSAGTSLAQTTAGQFFLTSLKTLLSQESPILLISLLKHPFTRLRNTPEDISQALKTLELYALRGLKPSPGLRSFIHRLNSSKKEGEKELNNALEKAEDLLKSFEEIMIPFKTLLEKGAPPALLLKTHEEFLKALSETSEGSFLLWKKEEEAEAQSVFQKIVQETENLSPLSQFSYESFLKNIFTKTNLQLTLREHPRLSILGLYESRLLKKDAVILGGLNEGTWPQLPSANPWIHKNLREALSLPPIEAQIGISIHDFLHAFLNKEVLLTRSLKTNAGIERPSRILVHLMTFLESQNLSFSPPPETEFLKVLDHPPLSTPASAPHPTPPLSARPHHFSPSTFELLIKDPYGFYAQTILNLHSLKPFEASPTAAEFGTLIHNFIETLVRKAAFPSEETLKTELKSSSLYKALSKGDQYFWTYRFLCLLKNFWAQHEKYLQNPELLNTSYEVNISHLFSIPTNSKPFEIKGRIDRLEELFDSFHIVDYKTGSLPTKGSIASNLSPQLSLLGMLLKENLISQKQFSKNIFLSYWPLKKEHILPLMTLKNPETLIENARLFLMEILDFFYNQDNPGPFRATAYAHSSYSHLARIQEWVGPLEALLWEEKNF